MKIYKLECVGVKRGSLQQRVNVNICRLREGTASFSFHPSVPRPSQSHMLFTQLKRCPPALHVKRNQFTLLAGILNSGSSAE